MPSYQLYSDDELFALLCNGDHGAYTEIYNRYSGLLYIHAYRRLKDRDEARDLIHELFTTLWVKRDQMTIKTALSSYLYKAVRNRIIDLVMRKKREIMYANSLDEDWESATGNTDHAVRQSDLHRLINKEIEALPEKMKIVFNLSRKGYLSHKEISDKLEISELTVRKQINNALKILKPKLSRFLMLIF
ncbi:RNA polymerase sigma factor [Pedobacter metabolipauper]|nr:RNA polymerase sigma-70 factor [Pedobacter metabolipauper]